MTQKTISNPWQMDVRVRERNLKSGALTEKDLEKHLSGLTDLADQVEPFATPQPALAQSAAAAMDDESESDLDDDAGDDGAGTTGEP